MIKLNGEIVIFEKFDNNEFRLMKTYSEMKNNTNFVEFKFDDNDDLIKLMLLKSELKCNAVLNIVYMPYSRMDREIKKQAFTLKTISNFINSLEFESVLIYEPHSNVCLDLIDNSSAYWETKSLFHSIEKEINFDSMRDYLMFPDKGAMDRYVPLLDGYKFIYADKKRCLDTGKILSLDIIGNIEIGSRVVILDDLSSYGGTFILSAEKLSELGVIDISLIVTHAEEAILKGKIPESELIKKVYTTNSIIDKSKETEKIRIKEII